MTTASPDTPSSQQRTDLFRSTLARVGLFFRLEKRILGLFLSYALAIALFSLIIPLTVQELINTFAFAIQPIMIVTLASIMMVILLCVAAFRALQVYAEEILEQRIFARLALALSQQLPRFREQGFRPRYVNYFLETVLMQRALSTLLVDLLNVVVGGFVGMTILVFYHPYFLGFNAFLLTGFDAVVKRMFVAWYFFTALAELDFLWSRSKDIEPGKLAVPLPDPSVHGVRLTCKDVTFSYLGSATVFENFNLEVAPGEKVAIFSATSTGKTTLARVLAGLYHPTSGVIRYNGVDLRDLDVDSLNACRGLMLDSQLTLFEGTLEENLTTGRSSIPSEDLRWALRFVDMEDEVDALPLGLKTPVRAKGTRFTTNQIMRILVARAIVIRPQILIFDGTLHSEIGRAHV